MKKITAAVAAALCSLGLAAPQQAVAATSSQRQALAVVAVNGLCHGRYPSTCHSPGLKSPVAVLGPVGGYYEYVTGRFYGYSGSTQIACDVTINVNSAATYAYSSDLYCRPG